MRIVNPMVMTGNLAENWKFWSQKFQTYLDATEISKKEDKTKCAQLLSLIGDEGLRIYNTFEFAENEIDKYKPLVEKFNNYFSPKRNLTFERHKFLTYKQTNGQSIENYITELKNLSLNCEFEDLSKGYFNMWNNFRKIKRKVITRRCPNVGGSCENLH